MDEKFCEIIGGGSYDVSGVEQLKEPLHILEQSSLDFTAHHYHAASLARQGRIEEGISEGKKAVKLRPVSASAHYNLGSFYIGDKQSQEAAKCFLRALEVNADLVEARAGLVMAYLEM